MHKLYLTYTTRQGSRVSCVAQTGFAAFGKGVQLISGPPYALPRGKRQILFVYIDNIANFHSLLPKRLNSLRENHS